MSKLTLIAVADGRNLESSKISLYGFKKQNNNIIVVNNNQSDAVNNLSHEIGATVYTPNKKYSYPIFTKDQTDEHIDFVYNTMFRPIMLVETEYAMVAEPDSLFFNPIDETILDGTDVIVSDDKNPRQVMWAFGSFYDGFGTNDEEKLTNIYRLFDEFRPFCKTVGLDFDIAAKKDMRFCFTANSIVKTESIRNLYLKEKQPITYLIKNLTRLVEKHRAKQNIPEAFVKFNTQFGPDQIFSIIFGLYLFTWKVNPNGLNCHPNMFSDEASLNNYVDQNPNIEYIHSCKLFYKK